MSDERDENQEKAERPDGTPVPPPYRLKRWPAVPGEPRPAAGMRPLRRSMDREEFEQLVGEAVAMLPAEFRQRMENIEVLVEEWPTPAQRHSVRLRPHETLFGLYEGIPRTRRGAAYNLAMPDRVWIFQGPIERAYGHDRERLRREVGRVVLHEIAHHFGIDDDRLRELGTDTMEYRTLGKAGVRVSPLCLGTMMFGGPTEEGESIRIIHRALDAGINFIDTANVYNAGESERIVGRALQGRRDGVVLATKVRSAMGDGPNEGGSSRFHIMTEVEASLRRLATDRIDLYFLHRPDDTTPPEETLRALDDVVRQGKVRYIGCSNFYAWQIVQGLWLSDSRNLERFVCLQSLYNIVNRDVEVEVLPACSAYGLGFVPYSPLARGVLSGKYRPGEPFPEGSRAARGDRRMQQTELREESYRVAQELSPLARAHGKTLSQLALAWLLGNPLVTSPIIGPRTMEQLEDNLGAMGWSLTPEDEAAIDRLVPPGEHTGYGFNDPLYPVMGRPTPAK